MYKKFEEDWIKKETERKTRIERKKQEEALRVENQKKRSQGEKDRQEQVWQNKNAVTAAEKRASCLHSEFWPRQQMKSKFKCTGCMKKRGPTAFKCPYCSTLQCQTCLSGFNVKRA